MLANLALACLSTLFPAVTAQPTVGPTGLTAHVTDVLSHGTLGDAFLSLDEAIRLCNGSLSLAQLSAAEAANVTGAGSAVLCIALDPMVTASITCQAALTPITGQGQGRVLVEGEVLPGPNHTSVMTQVFGGSMLHILRLETHLVTVSGLHFDGGVYGVDVHTTQAGMGMGQMAELEDCDFHGQALSAVHVSGAGVDRSGVMLHHVHFHLLGCAVLMDDYSAGGWAMVHAMHCHFENVNIGCEVWEGGLGGAMSMAMFYRSSAHGGANFMKVRRVGASTQQLMVRLIHCDLETVGHNVDIQGNASGLTMVHHHHSRIAAPAGYQAMMVGPKTALLDFHGSEVSFEGDVSIAANLFTQRVWQQNNSYQNGTITIDVDGSLPNLLWNRFDNCQIVVPSAARSAVRLRSSELVASQVLGQSVLAPITLEGCYSNGSTFAGQATATNPAPSRFLAVCSVSPTEVPIGSSFDLVTDAPPSVGVFWVATLGIDQPNTTQEPFRFYGDPATAQILALSFGLTTSSLQMPNDPAFVGVEIYMAPLSFSALGYGPEIHMPAGGRVEGAL